MDTFLSRPDGPPIHTVLPAAVAAAAGGGGGEAFHGGESSLVISHEVLWHLPQPNPLWSTQRHPQIWGNSIVDLVTKQACLLSQVTLSV